MSELEKALQDYDKELCPDPGIFVNGVRALKIQLSTLQRERDVLREAILNVPQPGGGRHSEECNWITGKDSIECDCGWNELCNAFRLLREQALQSSTSASEYVHKSEVEKLQSELQEANRCLTYNYEADQECIRELIEESLIPPCTTNNHDSKCPLSAIIEAGKALRSHKSSLHQARIEAMEECAALAYFSSHDTRDKIVSAIRQRIEQLKKEQT